MEEEDWTVPWAGATRSYAGWVPNVRSHLSFSVIGASRRAEAYSRSYHDGTSRLVVAIERRTSHDYPWPQWLVRRLWPDLTQHWLMEGKTRPARVFYPEPANSVPVDPDLTRDRQGMLVGRVHVFPYQEEPVPKDNQDVAIKAIREELLLAPANPDDAELDALHQEIVSRAMNGSLNRIEVQFALLRTGELRLWYAEKGTPTLDPASDDPEDDLRKFAEQAYFFIKDVVHDHTHHDPSSDQITPLVQINSDKADASHLGEVAWRRETLWSLSREIERLNRDGGLVDRRRSLGIVAYAQAFQQGMMGHLRDPDKASGFRAAPAVYDYDFAHLKESIRSSIDVASAAKAQFVQLTIAFVATAISAISLVASLTSAHNGVQTRDPAGSPKDGVSFAHGDGAIAILAWNPFLTGGTIAIVLLGVLSATLADGEAGLFNSLQRVISQLSRATSISLARSSRKQVAIDWGMHVVAALLALAGAIGCLVVLTTSLGA
ncbi:hypothetical protein [Sphingomonas insulae]|uniref:Uncharacterized protein n=1 Tax=Sphingomonas insulae TaxID=424800 RepID=A0ABP3SWJ2_9SPHN|nr:hypothetical protein [Sphingomonas insulae]